MRHGAGFLSLSLAAALSVACGQSAGAGYPLYKPETPRRPAAQIAHLRGPLAKVDDRDVSALGQAFDVEPGCHVLEVTGQRSVFATTMTAGHVYLVETNPEPTDANHHPVALRETAPDGTVTTWGPMQPQNAAAKCRALRAILMKE
jgi:hypothetical protein